MKTFTFIIDDEHTAHVDLYNEYGYSHALALLKKVYPTNQIKWFPVVMIHRKLHTKLDRHLFVPFGSVQSVHHEGTPQQYLLGE
jgi:hypothetical protein